MSAWSEYKKKLGETRPWDMLNPNVEKVDETKAAERMAICVLCPRFISLTTQCRECGCVMTAKTKLAAATCPLGKW
jgi:hypothetical protein